MQAEVIVNGGLIVLLVVLAPIYLFLMLLPVKIARMRRHRSVNAVKTLAFISLFIPVLWIAAIIWACVGPAEEMPARRGFPVDVAIPQAAAAPAAAEQATCENCGRRIGKLETPHPWQSHVVCGECLGRLKAQA
jgi:hypothetical protein